MNKKIYIIITSILAVIIIAAVIVLVFIYNQKISGEYCLKAENGKKMSLSEAKKIAEESACAQEGIFLENHYCNENTGTWWIDLQIEGYESCSPVCVVNVETKQAEINYRCAGLIEPLPYELLEEPLIEEPILEEPLLEGPTQP